MHTPFGHEVSSIKSTAYLFRLWIRQPKQPKPELPELSEEFSSVMSRGRSPVGSSGGGGPWQTPARLEMRKQGGSMPQGYRQASLGRRSPYHESSAAFVSPNFLWISSNCVFPISLRGAELHELYNNIPVHRRPAKSSRHPLFD